jgi:hypothetical protein
MGGNHPCCALKKAKAEAVLHVTRHNCRGGNSPECRVHVVAHGVSLACVVGIR